MSSFKAVYQQLQAWLPLLSNSQVYGKEYIQAVTVPTNCLQVGEAFADNKTVTVAKIDATANDVPSDKFSVGQFCSVVASILDMPDGWVDHSAPLENSNAPIHLHQPLTFASKF